MVATVWSYVPYFGKTSKPVKIPESNDPTNALTKKTEEVKSAHLQQSAPVDAQPLERKVSHLDPSREILNLLAEKVKLKPEVVDSIVAELDEEDECAKALKEMLCGQSVKIFEHYDNQKRVENDSILLEKCDGKAEDPWPIYISGPIVVVSGIATVVIVAGKVAYRLYIEASRVAALATAVGVVGVAGTVVRNPAIIHLLQFMLSRAIK